jgi:hypothetical protein
MKKISGSHLTQTNKKHISAILNAGLTEGKIGRISYRIEQKENNTYQVVFQKNDRGWGCIGDNLRTSTYKTIFSI